MRTRRLHSVILAAALLLGPVALSTQAKGWEPYKTERSDVKAVARDGDVDVKIARGVIIITTSRATTVKVYTILGQLVSAETIGPGAMQLRIGAHGVYIVKVGSLTCKVLL